MTITISFSHYLIFTGNFIHKSEKIMTSIGRWKYMQNIEISILSVIEIFDGICISLDSA